jgi:glycosyltransferase involved in cell wall biosynthesis
MNKKTLYIIGPKISKKAPDGGQVRVYYISKALESLYCDHVYVDPAAFQSYKSVIKYAIKDSGFRNMLFSKRNKIIASNGYPINARLINFISKIATLLYFDYHDDPKIQFKDLGIKTNTIEIEEANKNLYSNLGHFRYIGLSSPGLNNFSKLDSNKLINATNSSDPKHFKKTKLPNKCTVGLIGSTSPGRGAEMLINSCIKLKKELPKLKLKLALNNIDNRGNLDDLVKKYSKYSWIKFEKVDYSNAPRFIAKCDVCVIPHKKTLYTDTVLPIKLFDYMASSRPIVTTNCRETAKLVKNNDCGVVCRYEELDLSRKIKMLLTDIDLAAKLANNGRSAVEKVYNWKKTQENVSSNLFKAI